MPNELQKIPDLHFSQGNLQLQSDRIATEWIRQISLRILDQNGRIGHPIKTS